MRAERRRRPVAVAAALIAAALTVTGCGQPAEDTTTGEPAATRTYTDVTGTKVEIPTNPQRVVALSEQDADAAVALGVKLVGVTKGRGQQTAPAYLADKLKGVELVGDIGRPSVDVLVKLKPDLVLFGAMGAGPQGQQALDQIRKLVPATVVTYKLDDDWKTAFANAADVLNKKDAHQKFMADYDKRVGEVKDKLGANAGAEISIVRWNPQGPGVMHLGAFASLVAADLGLKRPAHQQEKGYSHSAPLSLEALDKIDADWLFLGTLNKQGADALAAVRGNPAFQQLKAVKGGHLVEVDGTVWTSRGGPVATKVVIDPIEKAMAAA